MNVYEPTPEQVENYETWVAERPPAVRVVAEQFRPWRLYRLESTGHRVLVHSFYETPEGVEITIAVLGKYNLVRFERQVFGIKPEELTECELPAPDEPVGVTMSADDIAALIHSDTKGTKH